MSFWTTIESDGRSKMELVAVGLDAIKGKKIKIDDMTYKGLGARFTDAGELRLEVIPYPNRWRTALFPAGGFLVGTLISVAGGANLTWVFPALGVGLVGFVVGYDYFMEWLFIGRHRKAAIEKFKKEALG